jgi:hypothetical protein
MTNQYVVVMGNAIEGFTFVGPFNESSKADQFLKRLSYKGVVTVITSPNDFEREDNEDGA